MKGKEPKTVKIDYDLHRILKMHCAETSCPIQDYINSTLNESLPLVYRVDFTKKKKKAK